MLPKELLSSKVRTKPRKLGCNLLLKQLWTLRSLTLVFWLNAILQYKYFVVLQCISLACYWQKRSRSCIQTSHFWVIRKKGYRVRCTFILLTERGNSSSKVKSIKSFLREALIEQKICLKGGNQDPVSWGGGRSWDRRELVSWEDCCLAVRFWPNFVKDFGSSSCRQGHAIVISVVTVAAPQRLDHYQRTSQSRS